MADGADFRMTMYGGEIDRNARSVRGPIVRSVLVRPDDELADVAPVVFSQKAA